MRGAKMNNSPTISVTKTYSLTLEHIAKVTDMADRAGVSQAEILRMAIDMLYQSMQAKQPA
jgi:hypothetical protein